MRRKNLPPALFEKLLPHFMHNLDETCLMCSDGVLKLISDGDRNNYDKNVRDG